MSFVDAVAGIAEIGDIAAPYALFYSNPRFIGTLVMDVTVREVHTDEDTITVHPVETGTPVSDHVFRNPYVVEISCGASDSTGGYVGYVQDVYQAFLALRAQRQPFDVSTGKRYYTNMLFSNITVVTDETSEFALMVTARLQEVIITDTDGGISGLASSVSNMANPASTAPEANVGNQALQPAPSVSPGAGRLPLLS